MTSLQAELDARLAEFRSRAPAAAQALIDAHIDALRADGAEAAILPVGSPAPDLRLPDQHGHPVALRGLGAAVIVFYRGGWCPYCNLTLRAWQGHLAALAARGARLVAISPEAPDNTLSTAERNALGFPVLSDRDGAAMRAFGLAYALPAPLQALYTQFGHGLDVVNGPADWSLPMPGTFAIDAAGRIVFAHAEADYRRRAEPASVLAALAVTVR